MTRWRRRPRACSYDVLVVADEAGNFGDDLAYRTDTPRPVAGTQGLVPAAWAHAMDEYASTQLQTRFQRMAGRAMTVRDYGAWLAVRAIGEAATRSASADPGEIIAYSARPGLHPVRLQGAGAELPRLGRPAAPAGAAGRDRVSGVDLAAARLPPREQRPGLAGPDEPETTCHCTKKPPF